MQIFRVCRGLAPATLVAVALLPAACRQDAAPAAGERWRPARGDVVVMTTDTAAAASSFAAMRRELAASPANPALAARFARRALEAHAATGDPRLLGYAAGALEPWRNDTSPPRSVRLLRARILQTRHAFAAAGAEADRLLRSDPASAEALLLAADAWRRAGELDTARTRCLRLGLVGRIALAGLCAADVLLSTGDGDAALAAATRALAGGGKSLSPEIASWAQAIRAEAAAAAGRIQLAEKAWLAALDAAPRPLLTLEIGYADLLLECGRYRRALERLEELPAADAVLLRRAIAAKELGDTRFAGWRDELVRRFADPARQGDDTLHLREQALFTLHVSEDVDRALALAKRNWAQQKGPEDAELLLRAAGAAGAPDVVGALERWRRGHRGGS